MDRAKDIAKLKALAHKGECTINWFDEGGGLVHKLWDVYVLFDVPQYGGNPRLHGTFDEGNEGALLDVAYSWN